MFPNPKQLIIVVILLFDHLAILFEFPLIPFELVIPVPHLITVEGEIVVEVFVGGSHHYILHLVELEQCPVQMLYLLLLQVLNNLYHSDTVKVVLFQVAERFGAITMVELYNEGLLSMVYDVLLHPLRNYVSRGLVSEQLLVNVNPHQESVLG